MSQVSPGIYPFTICLVTNKEPILSDENPDHCYLKTGEFSADSHGNVFQTGIVTYDDRYESVSENLIPIIKVNPKFISNRKF